MSAKQWKTEVLTIPNLLSLIRLALIPLYVTLYRQAETSAELYSAVFLMILSCLTDALDGWIARRFHMVSLLGKFLDPLADKITQLAMILCLCRPYPSLKPVTVLLIFKELLQTSIAAVYFMKGKILPGALMAGKICTAVLFTGFIALAIFPRIPRSAVSVIAAVDSIFIALSLISYLSAYCSMHPLMEERKTD